MKAHIFTNEEQKWIHENYFKMTNVAIAKHLNTKPYVIERYAKNEGLVRKDSKREQYKSTGVKIGSQELLMDAFDFRRKIEKMTRIVKVGLKVGPYVVEKIYPYHCICLTPQGQRESFTYVDLAHYIK